MATDDQKRSRTEIQADQKRLRLTLQGSSDGWRVLELGFEPEDQPIPRSGWMTLNEALAERDRMCDGS